MQRQESRIAQLHFAQAQPSADTAASPSLAQLRRVHSLAQKWSIVGLPTDDAWEASITSQGLQAAPTTGQNWAALCAAYHQIASCVSGTELTALLEAPLSDYTEEQRAVREECTNMLTLTIDSSSLTPEDTFAAQQQVLDMMVWARQQGITTQMKIDTCTRYLVAARQCSRAEAAHIVGEFSMFLDHLHAQIYILRATPEHSWSATDRFFHRGIDSLIIAARTAIRAAETEQDETEQVD